MAPPDVLSTSKADQPRRASLRPRPWHQPDDRVQGRPRRNGKPPITQDDTLAPTRVRVQDDPSQPLLPLSTKQGR